MHWLGSSLICHHYSSLTRSTGAVFCAGSLSTAALGGTVTFSGGHSSAILPTSTTTNTRCPQGPTSITWARIYRQYVHVHWAGGYAHTGRWDNSHGHSAQMSAFFDFPSQSLPPLAGAGLLHILINCRVPPPQVALQGVTSFQGDQPPSIATIKYIWVQNTLC